VAEVQRRFNPLAVRVWGERGEGPLWEGRDETGGDGRAYVCRDHTCRAPVDSAEALAAQLISASATGTDSDPGGGGVSM
jgi:uncharacterized protein